MALGLALIGGVYLWTRRARMQAALVAPFAADEPRWPLRLIGCVGVIALPWLGDAHLAALFATMAAVDLAVGDACLRRSTLRRLRAQPPASVRA